MKFTLTYEGPLKSQSKSDAQHKHSIRECFHHQLVNLWKLPPLNHTYDLATAKNNAVFADAFGNPLSMSPSLANKPGWLIEQNSAFFLPIVSNKLKMTASISITWFRREEPGKILQIGDIDNRLKVLCDALQLPTANQMSEMEKKNIIINSSPTTPFCCVLEDDALISNIKVQTEQLLRPLQKDSDILLIIKVETHLGEVSLESLSLV